MGIKASSQITLTDITDAYSVFLTSESYTFIGDTTGAPSGLSCTTQVAAYCGNQQCSKVNISTILCPTGISAIISDNNTSSPTITFTTTATINSACEATIPVEVDGVTVNKKFFFSVVKELEKEFEDLTTRVANAETLIDQNNEAIKLCATKTEVVDMTNLITGDKNLAKNTNQGSVGWHWLLDDGLTYIPGAVTENGVLTCCLSRITGEYNIDAVQNEDGTQSIVITEAGTSLGGYSIKATGNNDNTQALDITFVETAISSKSYIYYTNILSSKVEPGVTYTLSFELKSTVANTFTVGFYGLDDAGTTLIDGYNARDVVTNAYDDINTWVKFAVQLKATDQILSPGTWYIFINGMDTTPGVSHQFKNLQLEVGTEATEWTAGTSLSEDFATRIELETYREQTKADLSIMSDEVEISVANVKSELELADDELVRLYREIRMNYDFTAEGQFIGKKDSNTIMKLVNDMLQILIAGSPVTTLDTKGLSASMVNIDTLRIGGYTLTKGVDGHLRLI